MGAAGLVLTPKVNMGPAREAVLATRRRASYGYPLEPLRHVQCGNAIDYGEVTLARHLPERVVGPPAPGTGRERSAPPESPDHG